MGKKIIKSGKKVFRPPSPLDFLKENFVAVTMALTALIIFLFSPANAQGIGYIAIVMTGLLFIVLALTAFISKLDEYICEAEDYLDIQDGVLVYFRPKRVLRGFVKPVPEILNCFYTVNRLDSVRYGRFFIRLRGSFTLRVLGTGGRLISEEELGRLRIPCIFGDLKGVLKV